MGKTPETSTPLRVPRALFSPSKAPIEFGSSVRASAPRRHVGLRRCRWSSAARATLTSRLTQLPASYIVDMGISAFIVGDQLVKRRSRKQKLIRRRACVCLAGRRLAARAVSFCPQGKGGVLKIHKPLLAGIRRLPNIHKINDLEN
jgi:hypothetical protein